MKYLHELTQKQSEDLKNFMKLDFLPKKVFSVKPITSLEISPRRISVKYD